MRHFRRAIALGSLTALCVGCSDGTGPATGGCRQTYEFGNYGCARIQGMVRNRAGAVLAGAWVSLSPLAGAPNSYDTPNVVTGATGQYSLEIHNFGPPPAGFPDTVPMYVRAFHRTDLPVADSVLVNLIFAPVGEVPAAVHVDLALH